MKLESSNSQNREVFISSLKELQAILKANGISKVSYNAQAIDAFDALSQPRQMRVIYDLQKCTTTCSEANKLGIQLQDTPSLLRFTLGRLGMKAPESTYSRIQQGDVVEAYSLDQIQLFRSLAFLELCNYTLADVIQKEWYHLYGREEEINASIFDYINLVLESRNDLVQCNIPRHQMTEIYANPKSSFACDYQFFAPVFSGPNQRCGFLCVIRAQVIETRLSAESKVAPTLQF